MASRNLLPNLRLSPLRLLLRLPSILGLLLSLGLLVGAHPATAQIKRRSKAGQDADHRRSQREARRLDSPYKDSHLQPGQRLKRGQGDQPHPEGSDEFRFENGNPGRAVKSKSPSSRRKRKED